MRLSVAFDRFSSWASKTAGKPAAFILAAAVILVWLGFGPFIGFTNTTYQLLINSATTVITFLMVFLLQASQNRDAAALHAKIDELVRVTDTARNDLIGAERRTEEEIERLRAQGEIGILSTESIL